MLEADLYVHAGLWTFLLHLQGLVAERLGSLFCKKADSSLW